MAAGLPKPRLLFLTPARPRPSGNGLAMRAWAVAQALGERYEVVIAVPGEEGIPLQERIRRALHSRYPRLYMKLYSMPGDWPRENASSLPLSSAAFDTVHVFRHCMAPYAERFLSRSRCQLDLDESEARTRARLADLHRGNGEDGRADLLQWESTFFQQAERDWLPRFEKLFVSSRSDREYLLGLGLGLQPLLLPNSVTLPEATDPPSSGTPFTLLFVGNLNYYPNLDAMQFFTREVLPLIHQRATRKLRVRIAGAGPVAQRKLLSTAPDTEWLGFVPDLDPLYRESHAVIVPLRAGGGTRIKIIEAFSHRRPVVATTWGSEGLDAVPGQHFLRADTPSDLAAACLQLMESPDLGTRLAVSAYDLISASYGPAALEAILG